MHALSQRSELRRVVGYVAGAQHGKTFPALLASFRRALNLQAQTNPAHREERPSTALLCSLSAASDSTDVPGQMLNRSPHPQVAQPQA
mmetsp:Transcript_36469/g.88188  ORF Transcript_36469/g.88188 Transcript_36469/m.88188 type:complete len:88 (-) Transcript_36469:346-609(-)